MTRIVIENAFVFLIPTFLYIAWQAFKRDDWPGIIDILIKAPMLNLLLLGAGLMLGTLMFVSSRSGNSPDRTYVPAAVEDGKLQPGHALPTSK